MSPELWVRNILQASTSVVERCKDKFLNQQTWCRSFCCSRSKVSNVKCAFRGDSLVFVILPIYVCLRAPESILALIWKSKTLFCRIAYLSGMFHCLVASDRPLVIVRCSIYSSSSRLRPVSPNWNAQFLPGGSLVVGDLGPRFRARAMNNCIYVERFSSNWDRRPLSQWAKEHPRPGAAGGEVIARPLTTQRHTKTTNCTPMKRNMSLPAWLLERSASIVRYTIQLILSIMYRGSSRTRGFWPAYMLMFVEHWHCKRLVHLSCSCWSHPNRIHGRRYTHLVKRGRQFTNI